MTGEVGITWLAPPSWHQVPDVTHTAFDVWVDQLAHRAPEGALREAVSADLEELRRHLEHHAGSGRTWLLLLPPDELDLLRVVGLAWWQSLTGVGVADIEVALRATPVGPGCEVRSQQWRRTQIRGRESLVIEQLVEQERAGFARPLVQRCVCLTGLSDDTGLLSLTVDTADLRAFEDLISMCTAVVGSVRFEDEMENSAP